VKLKKILAMVLTIAMALSVCSVSSFAATNYENLVIGETKQLSAPAGATGVVWSGGTAGVATVDTSGLLTAVGAGNTVVTVTYTASGATTATTDTYSVTVTKGNILSVTPATSTIELPYGVSYNTIYAELAKVKLYANNGKTTFEIPNDVRWVPNAYSGEVNSVTTYTAAVENTTATINVKIVPAMIQVDFGVSSAIQVPKGTSVYELNLPTEATVKFLQGSTVVDTQTWYVGNDGAFAEWYGANNYNGDRKDSYPFTTGLNASYSGKYYVTNPAALALNVEVTDTFAAGQLSTSMTYTGDYRDDEVDLDYVIATMLEEQYYDWNINIYDVNVENNSYYCRYGSVYDGVYSLDIDYNTTPYNQLMAGYKLTEEAIRFTALDDNGNTYSGTIVLTITSGIRDYTYKMGASEFEFEFGKWIAGKISADMVETLEYVEFYIEDNYGGTMYADKDLNEFQEEEAYSYSTSSYNETSELEELYFVPDGTENYYELSYIAYGKYNEKLEGTITIECREFLMIRGTVGTDEYLTFDSDDFVEMIANSSYDDYELISIDSLRVTGGGKLYYDYDEESNRNTAVSNRTDYFVDASEDNCIDYISYVPAANAESGTVTVTFKLYLKDGNKSQSPTGIYQINVIEKADITVQTGIGQQVKVDMDLFEEYLEDNVSTSKANYEMVYITFKNAPAAKNEGYLYADGDKITSPDDEKFYTEDEKDGDYPAYDLVFVGGNTAKTTQAQFTIYGKRNANSTPTKLVEGSIDFIVGTAAANSLSGAIKAAETMSFATSLSAFEAMGNNDNEYITFTSLPVGGKLVYGWGTASQEDVRIGTEYYLSYKAGQKMLSNVTFVPSYSSSKIAKTITIGVQGYNEKDRAVTGTVNITVTYAAYSKQFTDVTTNTYADSVDFLLNQGITTGATTYTFNPNGNVKRAEFVTFLWRAAGKPEPSAYVTNKFTDVKNSGEYQYAYKAILWAVEKGITTGTTATTFSPAANVTHEQLIAFLYRYDVNLLGHAGTGSYTVSYAGWSSVPQYAQAPAKWAAYKGILTDSTTYPTTAGTRATVALWLHRMLTL